MNENILAIIPARGESKRLTNKNILDFCGKPLISWSIEAAKSCKYIDNIVVSSDSEVILEIAESLCVDTLKRPNILATDTSSTFDVVFHVLEHYKNLNIDYDYIVLLQPTSPLREEKDITFAIRQLKDMKADNIVSISECEHSPLWTNRIDSSLSMKNFLDEKSLNKRSQDLEVFYRINGAIYICNTKKLLDEKSFIFRSKSFAYIMPKERSIDIDTKIDFQLAEIIKKDTNEF